MQRRDFLLSGLAAGATATGLPAGLHGADVSESRLDKAYRILDNAEPGIQAGTILLAEGSRPPGPRSPEKVYLIASLTKPMTAAGVMVLADRGELSLDDPAVKFLPEFNEGERSKITIRHLLTHTSGLPDMLPENVEMRQRHAPLEEFVERALRVPLKFSPGSEYSYQSMGILLAAEIVERITKLKFRAFLRDELFHPLGMNATALGLGDYTLDEVVPNQVQYSTANGDAVAEPTDWDWNSRYWRDLGAPWGGAHSTTRDIARFLHSFLHPDGKVLKEETARMMVRNHTPDMRASRGIGFQLDSDSFGKKSSAKTFGHGGSTGCLCWADPAKDRICVILTSMPANISNRTALRPISDLLSA